MSISRLNEILFSYKIKATCIDLVESKNGTVYYLRLTLGEKLSKIKNIRSEIAFLLKFDNIPEISLLHNGLLSLEFKSDLDVTINLQDLYKEYKSKNFDLPFLLGKYHNGEPVWLDMTNNPHLLIGGATGTGKSVLLHNLIFNILHYKNVELYLTDTKLVEFTHYENLRQVCNIASDYSECLNIVNKLDSMMEERFFFLKRKKISSLEESPGLFNRSFFILDEAAEILSNKDKKFEEQLCKLAPKCRAAGIHLIIATQRPSADILNGLIKNNFPGRIACRTSSKIDSQIILDTPGAEALLGKGQALMKNSAIGLSKFQIGFINPKDVVKTYE